MLSAATATLFPTLPLALPRLATSPLLAEAEAALITFSDASRLMEANEWACGLAPDSYCKAMFDKAMARSAARLGRAVVRLGELYAELWKAGEGEFAERLMERKRAEIGWIDRKGATA